MSKRYILIEKRGGGKQFGVDVLIEELGFVYTSYDTCRTNEIILFSDMMGHSIYMKPAYSKETIINPYNKDIVEIITGRKINYTINDFKRDIFMYYEIKKLTKYIIPQLQQKRPTLFDKLKSMFK